MVKTIYRAIVIICKKQLRGGYLRAWGMEPPCPVPPQAAGLLFFCFPFIASVWFNSAATRPDSGTGQKAAIAGMAAAAFPLFC